MTSISDLTLEQRNRQDEEWKAISEQYGISLSFARFLKGASYQGLDQEYLRDPTKAFGPDAFALLGFWKWLDVVPKKLWLSYCETVRLDEKEDIKKIVVLEGGKLITLWEAMAYSRPLGKYGNRAFRGVLAPDNLHQAVRTAIKIASVEAVNLDTMELYFLNMFGFSTSEQVRELAAVYKWSDLS